MFLTISNFFSAHLRLPPPQQMAWLLPQPILLTTTTDNTPLCLESYMVRSLKDAGTNLLLRRNHNKDWRCNRCIILLDRWRFFHQLYILCDPPFIIVIWCKFKRCWNLYCITIGWSPCVSNGQSLDHRGLFSIRNLIPPHYNDSPETMRCTATLTLS